MKLDYYSRQAYARTIASNAGLTLVESRECKTPMTDGRSLYVPWYEPSWDAESPEEIKWWGQLCHETYHNDKGKGHHKHFELLKNFVEELKRTKRRPTKLWKICTNILEDLRIEKREYGEYIGQDRIMEKLRKQMSEMIKKNLLFGSVTDNKTDVIFMLQWLGFTKWNKALLGVDVMGWAWSDATRELFSKVEDLLPELYSMDNEIDTFYLTEEILKRLADEDEEDPTSEEDDGKPEGDGEPGDEEADGTPKYVIAIHRVPDGSEKKEAPKDCEWKYVRDDVEDDYPGNIPMKEIASKSLTYTYNASEIMRHVKIQGLAAQIKRYLMVRSATRLNSGHKRGTLDSGALWKGVVYKNTDTGNRVFKQKEDSLTLDTAVTLLIDESGSMGGRKFEYAGAAAVALNEVLCKIGVKVRVAGFGDHTDATYSYLHKNFDEKVNSVELATRIGKSSTIAFGGNPDGECLMWEYGKLVKRTEPKKVLVVLSDGMPSDSKCLYNCERHLREVTKAIEKEGKVTLIGIGILDGSVTEFYTRSHVVRSVDNIEEVLLNLLKKEVLHD